MRHVIMGLLSLLLFVVAAPARISPLAAQELDYSRNVRPILARNCFRCHGQDQETREAGLRLDLRESAVAEADSGAIAIVPGDPDSSELIARVSAADDSVRMPPADVGEKLDEAEIGTLKHWIEQGAPYADHWSFEPPRRSALPSVQHPEWVHNAIDYFILERLEREGLEPSPEAARHLLLRRLSFDLRGLPPTSEEVDAFVKDQHPNAYERLVDRLLSDPAYGERWAGYWLDLARYADSSGLGSDPLRLNMWRYRDWVVDAFNSNLRFDRFTIEQLAGDLLPESTLQQRMATALHRNTMTNTEGGTDDEEFRVAAVKDRAETTIRVWMGLTMQCANCHDHKYDPISQKDYYRFFAVFNQTADADRGDEAPVMDVPTDLVLEARARIDQQVNDLRQQVTAIESAIQQEPVTPAPTPLQGRFVRVELPGKSQFLSLAEVQVFAGDENIARKATATQSSTAYEGPAALAIDGNTDGDFFQAHSTTHTAADDEAWWEVDLGDTQSVQRIVVWNRTDGTVGSRLTDFRVRLLDAARETIWQQMLAAPPNPSSELRLEPPHPREAELQKLRDQIAEVEKSRPEIPTLPVMQELPADQRRTTFVMLRGNFLTPGDPVEPGLLNHFLANGTDFSPDRLGAARWLVHDRNPLVARVTVNRLWSQLFGAGLVETEEDFGTQGDPPSHRELLDGLAVEFVDSGWDLKHMLRLMVTSATYRQSATATEQKLAKDPRNRLLSRGPRIRLDAELVRDQALELSGLLSRKMYGPSVYPYQPPGLWRAAFNGERTWPSSQGEDRFRRGLYTFWRRTVPYPSMQTFDAPSREMCTVRRTRTNTPLQALVTLNDPVYVEAAQALARRIWREGGSLPDERAQFALRLCLARPPEPPQVQAIAKLYESERAHFQQNPDAARQLATEPLGPAPADMDLPQLAAWTVVANTLLNLDGLLTK